MKEAELWYREALNLSPPEGRDTALVNLVLLMRAEGGRLQEAVDLIIRCDTIHKRDSSCPYSYSVFALPARKAY